MPRAEKRQTHFQVVPLPEKLREKAAAGREKPRRVLLVGYDAGLLETRRLLLQGSGFRVSVAGNRADALAACRARHFDLAILGNAVPRADKLVIIAELRQQGDALVLALRTPNESPLPQADRNAFPPERPEEFAQVVDRMLRERQRGDGRG